MHKPVIKVCGMREGENIRAAEQCGVDMVGFIFYPYSPRYVERVPGYLPQQAKRVGVFVNEALDAVREKAGHFALDYLQLHGSESPQYCRILKDEGYKIIKNVPVAGIEDLSRTDDYKKACDLFLFDTKCNTHGGSGIQFDWNILSCYKGNTPFLLSGGIDVESAKALRDFNHPQLLGYDLNSKFETAPGEKDIKRISTFIQRLNA